MIYCIWYPSGGFGHFINAVITTKGREFARPKKSLVIDSLGTSHNLDLVMPVYREGQPYIMPKLDPALHYSVLIDNGIANNSANFLTVFKNSVPIKICYDDYTWPVIANTCVIKAMNDTLENQILSDLSAWDGCVTDWVKREKFFLFLRDHPLRHAWKSDNSIKSIEISDIKNYINLKNNLNEIGIILDDFREIWTSWREENKSYFDPVDTAKRILDQIKTKTPADLSHITDIWTQAVIYYYLWLTYQREVPHNDYANFFMDTREIVRWLDL